jgi:hypothetical protein
MNEEWQRGGSIRSICSYKTQVCLYESGMVHIRNAGPRVCQTTSFNNRLLIAYFEINFRI